MEDNELIVVRRRRRDWRTARYRLADIGDLHLREHDRVDYVPGDLSLASHDSMIHGYVRHEDMVGGELDGSPTGARRRVRICITRKDNTASAYDLVQRRIRCEMSAIECPPHSSAAGPRGIAAADRRRCNPTAQEVKRGRGLSK